MKVDISINVYCSLKVHGTQCIYRAVSEHLSFQYLSLIKDLKAKNVHSKTAILEFC